MPADSTDAPSVRRFVGGAIDRLKNARPSLPETWRAQGPLRWDDDASFDRCRQRLEARARRRDETLVLAEVYCRDEASAKKICRALETRARLTDVICRSKRPSPVATAGGVVLRILMPATDEAGAVPLLNALAAAVDEVDQRPTVSLRLLPAIAPAPAVERNDADAAIDSAA